MKLGAVILVLNEWRFVPAVAGQLLKIVGRCLVLRGTRPFGGGSVTLTPVPALDPRIEVLEGNWSSENETRNAGLDLLSDCDYVFMVDSDEILLDDDLEKLRDLCMRGEHRVIGVGLLTYWKSPEYRIDPPEDGIIKLVVQRGVRFDGLRDVREPVYVADVRCRHLSYVRSDPELREKLRHFSHAGEIRPSWYESVWKAWDKSHDLENLHPVHPSAYRRAIFDPDPKLNEVLARWGASTQTHWQKIDHIIGPATRDDFGSAGQKETRDSIEAFILKQSAPGTLMLDAGCSTGVEAHRLFEKGFPGTYVGVDSNLKALRLALENLSGRSASFLHSDLDALPYGAEHFDVVLVKDVIEHARDYREILAELARVAKQWLVLSMFIRMHDEPDLIKMDQPGLYLNRYQRAGVYSFLSEAGFDEPLVVFRKADDEVLAFRRKS